MGGIPNFLATLVLPFTSISHHQISEISHSMMKKVARAIPSHQSKIGLVKLIRPPDMIVIRRMKMAIQKQQE